MDGFEKIEVENEQGVATIALQGAQVLAWEPKGERPVIWLSREARYVQGKSARGGIPLCWPWFGPHPVEPSYPTHGFARSLTWELKGREEVEAGTLVVFGLLPHEPSWPHSSELECRISVGRKLEVELVTYNRGDHPFTLGCALHTYFSVSDVRKAKILGLEGTRYLDKVNGGERIQEGAVTIHSEVDRIYLDTASTCLIEDPGWNRIIRIEKAGSRSTVVWNPWIEKAEKLGDMGKEGYLGMLCVESCNAAQDVVTVPPSGEHRLKAVYSVLASQPGLRRSA